ncbi:MAG: PilZ domain-containing protein [Archangiaceae bacterium]|nr:PilZ domain-containing protein [Archangiaceae bacterium]
MPRAAPTGLSRGPIGERRGGPGATGKDARKYPRAELGVKARLSLSGDRTKTFEASLPTTNISVGGMFLESTFFLKIGTLLDVVLELPPHGRTVHARAQVVRVETLSADASQGQSGFALRFIEYLDGSEVVLATYFLAPVLREFIQRYAQQHKLKASEEYLSHTADVLAAWELRKAELGADVWDFKAPAPPPRSPVPPKRR